MSIQTVIAVASAVNTAVGLISSIKTISGIIKDNISIPSPTSVSESSKIHDEYILVNDDFTSVIDDSDIEFYELSKEYDNIDISGQIIDPTSDTSHLLDKAWYLTVINGIQYQNFGRYGMLPVAY